MTLLITMMAAVAATVVWYVKAPESSSMKLGTLCLMYWGASIMWLVDAIAEYAESGAEAFSPAPYDMLNDAFLGLCVVTLGLVIWLVMLLAKDPKGIVRDILTKKERTA